MNTHEVEELRQKLLEDARKKSEEIIREAKREAERIIEEAERKWREKAEQEREKIIANARLEAQKIISEARRNYRITISKAKAEVINKILEEAKIRLTNRIGFDIEESLKKLLDEALYYIENPSKIIINPRDRDVIKKILKEKGLKNIEIVESNDILGGLIIESINGERVDNSYNTRLERAKSIVLTELNIILWGK